RSTERRVETTLSKRVQQGAGLEQPAALFGTKTKRIRSVVDSVPIGVHDQLRADLLGEAVAKFDHLPEFVSGIDMQQRKRQLTWIKRLLGQPDHHRGVFPDRVQHHRFPKLGCHFTENMNTLRLQHPKMCQRHLLHVLSIGYQQLAYMSIGYVDFSAACAVNVSK